MNIKKVLIGIGIVVIVVGLFFVIKNCVRDSKYTPTGKYIKEYFYGDYPEYEIYADSKLDDSVADTEVVLFANSEYKYRYFTCKSCNEHAAKIDGDYVPLSSLLRRMMFIPEIFVELVENSGIGERVYWEDIE